MAGAKPARIAQDWWERWPALYEEEVGAFKALGVEIGVTRKAAGILTLHAGWPLGNNEVLDLDIGFSPLHPFVRPMVAAPNATFERHQHPIAKELCLLTQQSGQWNSRQLVATFIQERLPVLLSALDARREGRDAEATTLEEQSADPTMPYYGANADPNSIVLFDGELPLPKSMAGSAIFRSWRSGLMTGGFRHELVLSQLHNEQGRLFQSFALPADPADATDIPGRWVRLKPPATDDPQQLLNAAEGEITRLAALQPKIRVVWDQVGAQPLHLTGLVFSEEVQYGHQGTGWLFVLSQAKFERGQITADRPQLLRGERASERDLFARLPVSRTLRSKSALIIGCGAIGGFVAVELARAGINRLTLLDRDYLQPGNSLRWPLGRSAWGLAKPVALSDFIARNYPWTNVLAVSAGLGDTVTNPSQVPAKLDAAGGPLTELCGWIQDADLVIDTSASNEVQHAVSYYARTVGRTYLVGNATLGLIGGIVARLSPDAPACWVCLQEHIRDDTIALRSDETGLVAPVGCADPTFVGGSYDTEEVSLEIVRSAIDALCDDAPKRDPVAVLCLKDDEGKSILPRWTTYALAPHPRCCGAPT